MVYNPMQAIEAFGAGRQFATNRRVGEALAGGDMAGAQRAAFQGGAVGAGMDIQRARAEAAQQARQVRRQMDEAQAAAALQRILRMGGVATGILSEVSDDQIDAYTREAVSRLRLNVPLPDRPITRADLEVFVAQAEAMAGELTAARDRNQVTLGQNEALVRREGGQDRQTLNQQGVRIQDEAERANRAGEAIDRFQADTGRINAQTARMGETRQQEAMQRELAGEADQGRRAEALASRFIRNDLVLQDIDRAIEGAGEFGSTGLLGQIFSNVGGTGARDLEALIDTVRANIGFDELQRMRDMSPTGGALGQVTERELAQLQAVLGNLETSQSQEQLTQNLRRLQQVYADAQRNIAEAYRQDFGSYPAGYGRARPQAAGQGQAQRGDRSADPLGIRY